MPISLSEATHKLLSGELLGWKSFGEIKAGQIQLSSPAARRLFHFLLSSDKAKVAAGSEELFDGLIAAWNNTSFDPAVRHSAANAAASGARWRLARMETGDFGGAEPVGWSSLHTGREPRKLVPGRTEWFRQNVDRQRHHMGADGLSLPRPGWSCEG